MIRMMLPSGMSAAAVPQDEAEKQGGDNRCVEPDEEVFLRRRDRQRVGAYHRQPLVEVTAAQAGDVIHESQHREAGGYAEFPRITAP